MLHCAKIFVAWLLKHDAIDKDDEELYEYAVQIFLITISPLILVVIIGMITGLLKNGILLIIPFLVMRKFSGGFHTRHTWTCLVLSTIILAGCMYITTYIQSGTALSIAVLLAFGSLIHFSPVESENKRLEIYEKIRYRKTVAVLGGMFWLLYVLLRLLQYDGYAVCIAVGIVLTALLQLPCIIQSLMENCKRGLP